jgi:HEAT repeat protein
MRKPWLLRILILVIAVPVALALVFPATVYQTAGWLRHEASFDGKPTNYWIRALKQERFLGHAPPAGDIGKTLREGGPEAVPVLCEIAEGPDENLRSEALLSLSLIGPDAKAATPVLVAALKKEENASRFLMASDAYAKVDPDAAVDLLSTIVRDKQNASRCSWALTALLKLTPDCRGALPVLNDLLNNAEEDPRPRVQAMLILWRLKQPGEPMIPALCTIVKDDKNPAGVQALDVLGEMGPAAKQALPDLVQLLDNPNLPMIGREWGPAHRAAVIRTIGRMGPEAGPAVPKLLALFENNKYNTLRKEVARALAEIGPPAKEAFPALLAVLTDQRDPAKDAVVWASLTLLAVDPMSGVAAAAFAESAKKPKAADDEKTLDLIREAALKIDPEAAARAGVR